MGTSLNVGDTILDMYEAHGTIMDVEVDERGRPVYVVMWETDRLERIPAWKVDCAPDYYGEDR